MCSLVEYDFDLSERLSQTLCYSDANNNDGCDSNAVLSSIKEDKYSLRPRSLRQQEQEQESFKQIKSRKPKQKPPPLSKYRRKTANARERTRMREINQAFETLRQVVPLEMAIPCAATPANEKLTKITTLRLAMQYIASLSAALSSSKEDNNVGSDFFPDYSDLDFLLESDGESLTLSEHSLLASSPDFGETSLSPVDFDDPSLLHSDFEHALDTPDFSDFF